MNLHQDFKMVKKKSIARTTMDVFTKITGEENIFV